MMASRQYHGSGSNKTHSRAETAKKTTAIKNITAADARTCFFLRMATTAATEGVIGITVSSQTFDPPWRVTPGVHTASSTAIPGFNLANSFPTAKHIALSVPGTTLAVLARPPYPSQNAVRCAAQRCGLPSWYSSLEVSCAAASMAS